MDGFLHLFDNIFVNIADSIDAIGYFWSLIPDTFRNFAYTALVLGIIVGLFIIAFELL